MRRIASPSSGATVSTVTRAVSFAAGTMIELVTTTSSSGDVVIRSTAGPDRTGWTPHARMRRAPSRSRALTAWMSVLAVSIMSSITTASLPRTSPIRCIATAEFGPSRRLSMIARLALSRLAIARARSTPPASGATMTGSRSSFLPR